MHLGRARRTQIYESDCCLLFHLRTRSAEETMLLEKQQQLGQQVFPCFMFFFQTDFHTPGFVIFFSTLEIKALFCFPCRTSAVLPTLFCLL